MATVIGTNTTITKDGAKLIQLNDQAAGGVEYLDGISLSTGLSKGQNFTLPLGAAFAQGQTRIVVKTSQPVRIKIWPLGFDLGNLGTTTTTTTTDASGHVPMPAGQTLPLVDTNLAADSLIDLTLPTIPAGLQLIAPNGANDVAPELTILVASK